MWRRYLGIMAGLRGCCSSRTQGGRVNDAVNTSPRSGFDVIIRPSPEGAGRTTPEQTGHYSHYNTKLVISRYFDGNSCRMALTEPPPQPSYSGISSEHCHPLCIWINAVARVVLDEGHNLTWIWRMWLKMFNARIGLCLIPNELL